MTRCKVQCSFIQPDPRGEGAYLHFNVVSSGSEENNQFFKYTPGGVIILALARPETVAQFETGKEYYIDIIPA